MPIQSMDRLVKLKTIHNYIVDEKQMRLFTVQCTVQLSLSEIYSLESITVLTLTNKVKKTMDNHELSNSLHNIKVLFCGGAPGQSHLYKFSFSLIKRSAFCLYLIREQSGYKCGSEGSGGSESPPEEYPLEKS